MGSNFLRTEQGNSSYRAYKASLDPAVEQFADRYERLIREFDHWLLIENLFPYDRIAEVHHLLVPKRVFPFGEPLSVEEVGELADIKEELGSNYDALAENFPRNRSVPGHFHLHLLVYKEVL